MVKSKQMFEKGEKQMEYTRHAVLGTLSERTDGLGNALVKEVSIISWNGNEPKIDIREWDADHGRMSTGLTLTYAEAKALNKALTEWIERGV